jgi:hypothetical protein
MLELEKEDFNFPMLMEQKLANYLIQFPFQQIQKYIFAFGMKNTAVFWDSKKKCQLDLEIASFVPVAQMQNHPVLFIGYAKDSKTKKKIAKCITKFYGNMPIIFLKKNNPGFVLELISQMYDSKIAYTDSRASNIIKVSQYIAPSNLKVIHYVAHSKKARLGFRSISQLYMYI